MPTLMDFAWLGLGQPMMAFVHRCLDHHTQDVCFFLLAMPVLFIFTLQSIDQLMEQLHFARTSSPLYTSINQVYFDQQLLLWAVVVLIFFSYFWKLVCQGQKLTPPARSLHYLKAFCYIKILFIGLSLTTSRFIGFSFVDFALTLYVLHFWILSSILWTQRDWSRHRQQNVGTCSARPWVVESWSWRLNLGAIGAQSEGVHHPLHHG